MLSIPRKTVISISYIISNFNQKSSEQILKSFMSCVYLCSKQHYGRVIHLAQQHFSISPILLKYDKFSPYFGELSFTTYTVVPSISMLCIDGILKTVSHNEIKYIENFKIWGWKLEVNFNQPSFSNILDFSLNIFNGYLEVLFVLWPKFTELQN